MREFVYHITDFSAGLRRFRNGPYDQVALTECLGFGIKNKALEVAQRVVAPRQATLDWPFPRYVFLSCCTLYVTRNQVFEVDGNWNRSIVLNLPAAEYYSFADFGQYILGCSSTGTVFQRDEAGNWSILTNLPYMSFVTNFKGQLVAASGRRVIWSAIGRLDFTVDRSNEAGNLSSPWNSSVLAVHPLGDALLVFWHLGVLELKPVSDPTPTFAVTQIADFGIANPLAVCGNNDLLIFVDLTGTLWGIDSRSDSANAIRSKLRPVELGYREFLETMDLEKISITYDPQAQKFYISDGVDCFIFSNGALTKSLQVVTSALNGYGMCITSPEVDGLIISDTIDFGLRGMKTINWLEFGLDTPQNVQASIFWRNSHQEAYRQTPWLPLSQSGQIALRVTAVDFKIGLRVQQVESFRLKHITARIQLSDKRTVRGTVNVSQITS